MCISKSPVSIGLAIAWACGLIWSAGNLALGSPQDMAALAGSAGGSTPDCGTCYEARWGVSMCTGTPQQNEDCPSDKCTSVTAYYTYCDFEEDAGECPDNRSSSLKEQVWSIYDTYDPCQSVITCGRGVFCGCTDDTEPNCMLEIPCCTSPDGNGCPSGTLIEEGESEEYRPIC